MVSLLASPIWAIGTCTSAILGPLVESVGGSDRQIAIAVLLNVGFLSLGRVAWTIFAKFRGDSQKASTSSEETMETPIAAGMSAGLMAIVSILYLAKVTPAAVVVYAIPSCMGLAFGLVGVNIFGLASFIYKGKEVNLEVGTRCILFVTSSTCAWVIPLSGYLYDRHAADHSSCHGEECFRGVFVMLLVLALLAAFTAVIICRVHRQCSSAAEPETSPLIPASDRSLSERIEA